MPVSYTHLDVYKRQVLGMLFRSKIEKESNAELLVFITPRILKS